MYISVRSKIHARNLIGPKGHCLDTSSQAGTRQGSRRGVISGACYKGALYQTDESPRFLCILVLGDALSCISL